MGPDHSRTVQVTCSLAAPAAPTLSSRPGVLDSEVVCLTPILPPTLILTRLLGPRSWSTPVSNSPPREAPWSSNPSSYPLDRIAGDIAQLSLPSRGAVLSEEPQLLTAEPLSPCPGFPWPRLSAPLEPVHLERWDRLGRARRIPRPPPALAARSRPLSEPGESTQAHPQAQSLCERAPYARSRARAHSLAPTT